MGSPKLSPYPDLPYAPKGSPLWDKGSILSSERNKIFLFSIFVLADFPFLSLAEKWMTYHLAYIIIPALSDNSGNTYLSLSEEEGSFQGTLIFQLVLC